MGRFVKARQANQATEPACLHEPTLERVCQAMDLRLTASRERLDAILADVEERILAFERYYESIATPFGWQFTRDDLNALLRKLDAAPAALRPAA